MKHGCDRSTDLAGATFKDPLGSLTGSHSKVLESSPEQVENGKASDQETDDTDPRRPNGSLLRQLHLDRSGESLVAADPGVYLVEGGRRVVQIGNHDLLARNQLRNNDVLVASRKLFDGVRNARVDIELVRQNVVRDSHIVRGLLAGVSNDHIMCVDDNRLLA